MIEANGLKKSFGEIEAVSDVSFAARDGRVTGLLGPNGAGKSTTLRMIYGLLKPDAGDIQINGTDVHADPLPAKSQLGCSPMGTDSMQD